MLELLNEIDSLLVISKLRLYLLRTLESPYLMVSMEDTL